MNKKNRILTLEVELVDEFKAEWIWTSHVNMASLFGIRVKAIKEGSMPKDGDEEQIDFDWYRD